MRERESPLGFSEPDLNARRIPGLGQEREREQRAGWVCWAGLWRAHPGACVEDWCPQVRGGCGLPCGWGGGRTPDCVLGRGACTNWEAGSCMELMGSMFKMVFFE